MAYSALPDRRMPYDNDGTVVGWGTTLNGLIAYFSGSELIELNDYDMVNPVNLTTYGVTSAIWWFFPERREVTAYAGSPQQSATPWGSATFVNIQGSDDTTNGLDGTWETASVTAWTYANHYSWRSDIKAVSFTGGKRAVRGVWSIGSGGQFVILLHLYGQKVAGQTPDDIIYIDHDTTPGVEYQAPEDFGNRPIGTTVTRQFRVKNTSATKTANTIDIQCNDADFVISTDNSTWVVTINIGSLAAGAESSTMYVRNTTPSPGGALGPRFGRIITTVASYT